MDKTLHKIAKFSFVVILIFLVSCKNKKETGITPRDSLEIPARGFFMGILPIPANGQSFEESHYLASLYAEFSPVWGRPTPFYKLADDLNGDWGDTFVEQYIRGNGMFPLIHLSFIGTGITLVTPPGLEGATLKNQEWREAYKQSAINVVKTVKPLYLAIGNEVNRWYEKFGAEANNPNGFQHYVSLYEEIYDTIKALSPETKIFCTFCREIVAEYREANLDVFNLFPVNILDILVLTSYPYAVQGINLISDIPNNYYSRVTSYVSNKPIGFSELGWPSIADFGGEQGQADFITEFSGRLTREQGINFHLFGWAWLHDLNENDHIGLIKRDRTEKLAYSVWKNLSAR